MIDVIIPCYNAETTLQRAVQSALNQAELGIIWIIDDGSTDHTFALAKQFEAQVPNKIRVEKMPYNSGVAKARNWGALQSTAELIAFLDADDAYEPQALHVAQAIFQFRPETALVRLAMTPVNLDSRYTNHPNFSYAWQVIQMTCASNMVFRRAFFLACGGFPQDKLFRTFGGEDGALGIATTKISHISTAFDAVGVQHFCRPGMHAEYLLEAILYQNQRAEITAEQLQHADRVTDNICQQITQLRACLTTEHIGIHPVKLEWN
ncbi:glycosyltransferase [Vespertiliibacter pulmonis]|uniref:Glycosyl transferase family 2 n=1 Tax=Vespertiliibacter pulmonis TaxID=1443036 RepID=A0A3N4VPL8_9PAST|nr:glycosyltransferase family A protein [Vespertiliibacter pulmonis]QLB20861.1 glycosyltransferase [Vespertiliibacter pulmonis]RPE83513.1 glycosyl transferase family 2 [Vespertiliibacter pulmonis]